MTTFSRYVVSYLFTSLKNKFLDAEEAEAFMYRLPSGFFPVIKECWGSEAS